MSNTKPMLENEGFTSSDELDKVVTNYLQKTHIKGGAIALFDGERVLWTRIFGYRDKKRKNNVNQQTIFSIQSISKTVTSTLVMLAVQEGLLSLDTPITDYLPNFKVNSCYEKNAEKLITIRQLLACTAGFPHEAPIGNNYHPSCSTYEEHYQSIQQTWLKFPVGSDYSYSNLGFDLVASIIETRSGLSFSGYMNAKLFQPLSMNSTTSEIKRIMENSNRAIGNSFGCKQLPVIIPMIGAGGVYTNMEDFIKFVQFHLNFGKHQHREILSPKYLVEMYKPILISDYALGIAITNEMNTYAFNHNGSGFGFSASVKWFPEYNLGCFMLTNTDNSNIPYTIVSAILNSYITKNNLTKELSFSNFNPTEYFNTNKSKSSANSKSSAITCAIRENKSYSDWNNYIGEYLIQMSRDYGFKWYVKLATRMKYHVPKLRIYRKGTNLYVNYYDGRTFTGEQKLLEYQPQLFFAENGDALDFRASEPQYRNLTIHK